MIKHIFFTVMILGTLLLAACSTTTLTSGNTATVAEDTLSVAVRDSLPSNGKCITLHMNDATQQLVYLRLSPRVKLQPRQVVVSVPMTTITYERQDVTFQQQGKALLPDTSTAGMPPSVKNAGNIDEMILFFGLPEGSHINIRTASGLQWLDKDIKGTTYALVLTELPPGKYIVSMNATTFRVELE